MSSPWSNMIPPLFCTWPKLLQNSQGLTGQGLAGRHHTARTIYRCPARAEAKGPRLHWHKSSNSWSAGLLSWCANLAISWSAGLQMSTICVSMLGFGSIPFGGTWCFSMLACICSRASGVLGRMTSVKQTAVILYDSTFCVPQITGQHLLC